MKEKLNNETCAFRIQKPLASKIIIWPILHNSGNQKKEALQTAAEKPQALTITHTYSLF